MVGGALYVYDGTTFALVEFFDDGVSPLPSFSSVGVLTNIFVFFVAGTTEYFWSKAGDATSINALNFANATTTPDPIVEVAVLSDELYFLKQANGTEIWDYDPIVDPTSGQITQPFQLSQGRTWIRGTPAQARGFQDRQRNHLGGGRPGGVPLWSGAGEDFDALHR